VVCECVKPSQTPMTSQMGGKGAVTYREEFANGRELNSVPEQIFFVKEEDLQPVT
jgi:hypothetical protein